MTDENGTPVKPTFDDSYPELDRIIASHRADWTYLSIMEWADVQQELRLQLSKKYHLYDPLKGPLENWAHTVIKHRLMNLRRDVLLRYSPPCIGGWKQNGKHCVYNTSNGGCSYTPSKTQCDECPVYADWRAAREHQLHIKNPVTLENHTQEVHNIAADFIDIDGAKEWLDREMLKELTRWEGRVYRLLYIQYISPNDASDELTKAAKARKRPPSPQDQYSYQGVLAYQRRFKAMMYDLLMRGGYIDAIPNPRPNRRTKDADSR